MQMDAYILIGGRSSRMGRDKASLELEKATLAERAASLAGSALPDATVKYVAANVEQFCGFDVICDIEPHRGPLGGLHAALMHAKKNWIFLLACDLPFVSVELIRFLASQVSDTLDAIVPFQPDGRLQPLCAFYRVNACIGAVEELLIRTPTQPLHAVFDNVRTRKILFGEIADLAGSGHFFFNINDRNDLRQAIRIVSAK